VLLLLSEEEPPAVGENLRRIVQRLSISHQRHARLGLAVRVLSPIIVLKANSLQLFCNPESGRSPTMIAILDVMRSRLSAHSAQSASGSALASISNSLHKRGSMLTVKNSSLTSAPSLLSITVSLDAVRGKSLHPLLHFHLISATLVRRGRELSYPSCQSVREEHPPKTTSRSAVGGFERGQGPVFSGLAIPSG
jgi:hypothetical protein